MLQLHTEHIAGQTTRTRTHTANLTSGAIRFLAPKVNIVFHRRRAPGVSAAETGDEGGDGYLGTCTRDNVGRSAGSTLHMQVFWHSQTIIII